MEVPKLQAQMEDYVRDAARQAKGILNFGAVPAMSWANQMGGVNYANATAGSQTYQASSLVNR